MTDKGWTGCLTYNSLISSVDSLSHALKLFLEAGKGELQSGLLSCHQVQAGLQLLVHLLQRALIHLALPLNLQTTPNHQAQAGKEIVCGGSVSNKFTATSPNRSDQTATKGVWQQQVMPLSQSLLSLGDTVSLKVCLKLVAGSVSCCHSSKMLLHHNYISQQSR